MEKLWGDVQSLVCESFESFQGNFREITHRIDQMEVRLTHLQEVVDQPQQLLQLVVVSQDAQGSAK